MHSNIAIRPRTQFSIMSNNDESGSRKVQPFQKGHDYGAITVIDITGGLICQDHNDKTMVTLTT
ncbi:MAG: hypothetical protein IH810_03570 [Proteobacteria bacterium]|nr:hypothetical protein [Pseudomonadota bacterium]